MEKTTYSKADFNALMRSDIPQSLVETKGMRFDDAEDASLYFARELDYIKAQSYDVEYPELTALSLFPIFVREVACLVSALNEIKSIAVFGFRVCRNANIHSSFRDYSYRFVYNCILTAWT